MSTGGLYTPAGTATNTPTATDEVVILSATTLVNATASQDRIWFCASTSDKKMFRAGIARQGSWAANFLGVELLTSRVTISYSPTVWAFGLLASNWQNWIGSSTTQATARINGVTVTVIGMVEGRSMFNTVAGLWQNTRTGCQGGTGYPIRPVAIGSTTTNTEGPIGSLIDMWTGRFVNSTAMADGEVYGNNQFIITSTGMMIPWDGVTTPMMT